MGAPDNKELSRRWFEEVWNRRNSKAIDELMAPDAVAHGLAPMDGRPLPGPAQFRVFWEQFCGAFPDIRITVEDVIAEGDKTAVRFSFHATHRGEHLGVPPTQKPISATGMSIIRWQNGRIVEGWNEFDALSVFQAAGVVQPTSQA